MQKNLFTTIALLLLFLTAVPSLQAQKKRNKKKDKDKTEEVVEPTPKTTPVQGAPKPYEEVITDEAVTKVGLMTTHKIGNKYYFELPIALMEKEIMVVSRISGYVKNLSFGGAGMKSRPQQVIRWQRIDDQILDAVGFLPQRGQ